MGLWDVSCGVSTHLFHVHARSTDLNCVALQTAISSLHCNHPLHNGLQTLQTRYIVSRIKAKPDRWAEGCAVDSERLGLEDDPPWWWYISINSVVSINIIYDENWFSVYSEIQTRQWIKWCPKLLLSLCYLEPCWQSQMIFNVIRSHLMSGQC